MTPGARVAATIEHLDEIVSHADRPADLVANAYFRARRYIGSGDRRAVSDRVWGILRRWGQLRWWLKRTAHPADQTNALARGIVAADLMVVEGQALGDVEATVELIAAFAALIAVVIAALNVKLLVDFVLG